MRADAEFHVRLEVREADAPSADALYPPPSCCSMRDARRETLDAIVAHQRWAVATDGGGQSAGLKVSGACAASDSACCFRSSRSFMLNTSSPGS